MSAVADERTAVDTGTGRRYRRRLFALAAFALLGLDQLTKWLIVSHYALGESLRLCSLLSITYSRNEGAAFGVWHGGGRALAGAAALLIVVVLAWGIRYASRSLLIGWGLACLVGGALGNLADRLRLGYVVDFIQVPLWPVFNVADTCVVIGAGLLMIYGIFGVGELKPPAVAQEDES